MNSKLKEIFRGKVVNKAHTINTGVDEFPRYVLEYLIDNYCAEETFHEDMEKVVRPDLLQWRIHSDRVTSFTLKFSGTVIPCSMQATYRLIRRFIPLARPSSLSRSSSSEAGGR